MFREKRQEYNGFTLLELLIYIAVSSIIIIGIVQSFFTLNRGRGTIEARSEVESTMRFAIEKITQDIRSSSSVIVPALSGASATTLEVIVFGAHIYYCVYGAELRRAIGSICSVSSETITGNKVTVDAITFTRFENTNTVLGRTAVSVEVQVTMSYNSASPDWSYTQTKKTTISLR